MAKTAEGLGQVEAEQGSPLDQEQLVVLVQGGEEGQRSDVVDGREEVGQSPGPAKQSKVVDGGQELPEPLEGGEHVVEHVAEVGIAVVRLVPRRVSPLKVLPDRREPGILPDGLLFYDFQAEQRVNESFYIRAGRVEASRTLKGLLSIAPFSGLTLSQEVDASLLLLFAIFFTILFFSRFFALRIPLGFMPTSIHLSKRHARQRRMPFRYSEYPVVFLSPLGRGNTYGQIREAGAVFGAGEAFWCEDRPPGIERLIVFERDSPEESLAPITGRHLQMSPFMMWSEISHTGKGNKLLFWSASGRGSAATG